MKKNKNLPYNGQTAEWTDGRGLFHSTEIIETGRITR